MFEFLIGELTEFGLQPRIAGITAQLVVISGVVLIAIVADLLAKNLILKYVSVFVQKTENSWDDVFLQRRVFHRLSHFAPVVVVYLLAPVVFPESEAMMFFLRRVVVSSFLILLGFLISSVSNAGEDLYNRSKISRGRPIRSYIQVGMLVVWLVLGILVLATLLDRSPLVFLSGLGALSAVLLLVFKDSILGLVASIQLSGNDFLRRGDWIEMPKYGADGDVLDVTLSSVKVQNWDKTISTIPTYSLVADSFKNWRGMSESGGRRIKRAIRIDMNSVRFCDDVLFERLSRVHLLVDYLKDASEKIAAYNEEHELDTSMPINGRRLTNLGIFRIYIREYLKDHPLIHSGMTQLVRQLPPEDNGVPIEVYAFSNNTDWGVFEQLQADIFDHLIAIIPHFDLEVFQNPSGADFRNRLNDS